MSSNRLPAQSITDLRFSRASLKQRRNQYLLFRLKPRTGRLGRHHHHRHHYHFFRQRPPLLSISTRTLTRKKRPISTSECHHPPVNTLPCIRAHTRVHSGDLALRIFSLGVLRSHCSLMPARSGSSQFLAPQVLIRTNANLSSGTPSPAAVLSPTGLHV